MIGGRPPATAMSTLFSEFSAKFRMIAATMSRTLSLPEVNSVTNGGIAPASATIRTRRSWSCDIDSNVPRACSCTSVLEKSVSKRTNCCRPPTSAIIKPCAGLAAARPQRDPDELSCSRASLEPKRRTNSAIATDDVIAGWFLDSPTMFQIAPDAMILISRQSDDRDPAKATIPPPASISGCHSTSADKFRSTPAALIRHLISLNDSKSTRGRMPPTCPIAARCCVSLLKVQSNFAALPRATAVPPERSLTNSSIPPALTIASSSAGLETDNFSKATTALSCAAALLVERVTTNCLTPPKSNRPERGRSEEGPRVMNHNSLTSRR
mmetsp:Transcript_29243/g.97082  ORF Transcript_29243/g.97082 Transcript_29243/m.97082 type:complete len:325 (-) Transcript_29243:62-1036(-)